VTRPGGDRDAGYARQKAAFLELLELDADARHERLAALAREEPDLAAALQRQLDAAGQPLPLLDRPASAPQPPQLPHYRLLRELGRGGMGVVWLAERALGDARQPVALKQIAHAHWTEEDRRRFERERRILAGLDHPNIAALVDGGSDAQGAPFLSTQFVEGEPLDRWCERHAADVRGRVRLLRDVAAAVGYAHSRLVVHRDLKPANILVTAQAVPKLLDFGIARALHEAPVTREGPSQMTLRYAAPEQVASDGAEAGVGVDIYALGVLAYELLARASPYGEVAGPAALVHAILSSAPVSPSRAARALPGVDRDLDAICLKALRKRPQDRYTSAAALAADLERWLAREPVDARHGERGYALRSALRRSWPWLAAGAVALALLGYHLAVLDRELARAERERDKAQALADYFTTLFEGATPADTERGEITARELLERSVASLERDRTTPANTRGAMLLAAGVALSYLGQVAAARDAEQAALSLLQAAEPRDPELLAKAHSELASDLAKLGLSQEAQRQALAGLAVFERGEARDAARYRTLEAQVAMFAEAAGDAAGAKAAYERIVRKTRDGLDSREAVRSYVSARTNLATTTLRHDSAASAAHLRDAIERAAAAGFEEPETLLPIRAYLGKALYNQRRLAEARAVLDPVLRDARAHYGSQDPWLGMILSMAGNLAVVDGRIAQGEALLQESARISAASAGPDHPNTRKSQADLALARVVMEDWPEAERRLQEMLAWHDRRGEGDTVPAQFLRAALAYTRARQDPSPAALAQLGEALAARQGWYQNMLWLSDDWRAWAERQRDRVDFAPP
jgi:eukaryotic-like serine/threonine-protein kinase